MIIRESSQQKRRFLSARLIPLTFGLQKMSLFIAIRIFRIQRDLTVVALVSCVYAYFLDLILFLAQVIMSCVRLTFPTELEFGPQWPPQCHPCPSNQALSTHGSRQVVAQFYFDFNHISCASLSPASTPSFGLCLLFCQLFCRVPCAVCRVLSYT